MITHVGTFSPASFAAHATGGQFLIPRHIAMIDELLVKACHPASNAKRIKIHCPVRHGKSMLCSKALPAWYLGRRPKNEVILTTHGASFSEEFGGEVRDMLTEHGMEVFGVQPERMKMAQGMWRTSRGGKMRSTGVGGSITGRGAHLLIIDDPIKNDQEALSKTYRDKVWRWFQATALSRLEPDATVIVIMTRWHPDDLAGRIDDPDHNPDADKWTTVNLPAFAEENDPLGRAVGEPLWPERFDGDRLERMERELGRFWFSALCQQRPRLDVAGAVFTENMINGARVDKLPCKLRVVCVGLDPSGGQTGADEQGIVAVGQGVDGILYVLLDNSGSYTENGWAIATVDTTRQFEARDAFVAVEDNFGGDVWRSVLAEEAPSLRVENFRASDNKEARAQPIASLMRLGKIKFVGVHKELEEEMTQWIPRRSKWSPNRMDAFVWATHALHYGHGDVVVRAPDDDWITGAINRAMS